jgi:probable F420-dependent oxidoreductase
MKLWYHAVSTPMDQLLDLAVLLDSSGFEGIALSHHLVSPEEIRAPYPYTPDNKVWWDPVSPLPDVWVTAAVIGRATKRLMVAPSVFILPMQDPFTVAKAVSTAAYFMDGRLVLGVGAGWMRDEFELTGQDFRTRGRRMDEMLVVLEKLFAGEMVDHKGEFYNFERLQMEPHPSTRIPVYIGGHSPAALRRAAGADGWFAAGPYSLAEAVMHLGEFAKARKEAPWSDRPAEVIVPLWDVPPGEDWIELADAGATGIMLVPAHAGEIQTLEHRRRFIERAMEKAVP